MILREINFGEGRGSKIAIFAFLVALSIVKLVNLSIKTVQKFIKKKITFQRL